MMKMPKIELHVHLDGSIRPLTAKELLNDNMELIRSQMVANDKCLNLTDYLTKFALPVSLMQTKENLIRVAYELTNDLESDNVIYAEIRFAPLKHTKYLTPEQVVESVLTGLKMNSNIKTNLILCMMRNDSFLDNQKVIELASKYLNKGVCAIDLAGDEINYETKNFSSLFKLATDKNIPFTLDIFSFK